MADKMTRKQALEFAIEAMTTMIEWEDFGKESDEAVEVLRKMVASIEKQNNRPKSKTSARIQNENSARLLIEKLRSMDEPKPINATWIAENIPYVMTSQRGYHVAKIAIEWGALEEVTIKKRTYYTLVETWEPTE